LGRRGVGRTKWTFVALYNVLSVLLVYIYVS